MNPNPNNRAARPFRHGRFLAVIAAIWVLVGGAGCEEIRARRAVQEANKEFEKGRFSKAAELYEEALRNAPHLDTAHYNAGLTYKKMFRPGVPTPENMQIAKAAAEHFAAYLQKHPEDTKIVDLMTSVWIESGDYQSALNYWERELAKNPKNTEVMAILAGISRQAGDWDKAIEWHRRQVDADADPLAKAGAYKDIGKLIASRLRGKTHKVLGYERLLIADTGIEALQKAAALTPDDAEIQTSLGFLYGQRALAQSATWAQMIEVASARHHYKKWAALNKKEQEAKAQEAGGSQEPKAQGEGQGEGKTETPPQGQEDKKTEGASPQGQTQEKAPEAAKDTQETKAPEKAPEAAKDTQEAKAPEAAKEEPAAAEGNAGNEASGTGSSAGAEASGG